MVAAFKLDDEVASGEAARQADGGHAGFSARTDEAQLFDRWEATGDTLSEVSLRRDGGPEARSLRGGSLDGFDDRRKGVSENHGTPGAEEIQVAVPIGVEEVGSFRMSDEGRIAAYCAEGPDRGIDSSRKKLFRAKLKLAGASGNTRHLFSIAQCLSKTRVLRTGGGKEQSKMQDFSTPLTLPGTDRSETA